MAKEVVGFGSITSAVTSAVADKAVSKFVDNLGMQTPVADKLQRLARLHMRIRSAVEVSEMHAIECTSLLLWREDLKEAAAHGGEVLLSFRQRDGNHQQQASSSSSTGTGTGTAMSSTRNALSSMARCISTAASALFSGDEDVRKLDSAVEALEKASENLGDFIALFRASPKLKRRRKSGSKRVGFLGIDQNPAEETAHDRETKELTMLAERLQRCQGPQDMKELLHASLCRYQLKQYQEEDNSSSGEASIRLSRNAMACLLLLLSPWLLSLLLLFVL